MKKNILFGYIIILAVCPRLFGQITDQGHYSLLLNEAQLFARLNGIDSQHSVLIDSAKALAEKNDYDMAIVYLEEYLAQGNDLSGTAVQSDPPQEFAASPHQFSIKTGVDFNRQEFEFGYVDSDSILLDQVSKPFIGLQAEINLWKDDTQNFSCSAFSRYDKEDWTSTADLLWNVRHQIWSLQLTAGTILDRNYLYPDFTFTDINSHQIINIEGSRYLKYYLDNLVRWKRYQSPSRVVPDYLRNTMRTGLRLIHPVFGNAELSYLLDWNESIAFRNNDFTAHEIWGNYNRQCSFAYLQADLGYRSNDYAFLLSDSISENRSTTLYGRVQTAIPVLTLFDIVANFNSRLKIYRDKSEVEPDYFHYDFSTSLRFVPGAISLETGYLHEAREHKLISGAEPSYILEQNYKSDGVLLNINLSVKEYLSLSASAAYLFRRYPDSQGADAFGIYNNRNILNLYLIGNWNINEKMTVNLFISYDNDDDLDIEYNTTRSSYYSLELEYRM